MKLKSNGYMEISLDLLKGKRLNNSHFRFWEDEILPSSSLPKSSKKHERKICKLIF